MTIQLNLNSLIEGFAITISLISKNQTASVWWQFVNVKSNKSI